MTDSILSALRRVAQTYPCDGVQDAMIAAITEIERLRSGGCARDQRTTQWCAEAEALRQDLAAARADAERYRSALREILEGCGHHSHRTIAIARAALGGPEMSIDITSNNDALAAEVSALRHDIARHVQIAAEQAQEIEELRRALHEIAEEWAGAECGMPVTAQEAYAIELVKRMARMASEALGRVGK